MCVFFFNTRRKRCAARSSRRHSTYKRIQPTTQGGGRCGPNIKMLQCFEERLDLVGSLTLKILRLFWGSSISCLIAKCILCLLLGGGKKKQDISCQLKCLKVVWREEILLEATWNFSFNHQLWVEKKIKSNASMQFSLHLLATTCTVN